jgi:sugar lactone lactonase YvrE
VAPTPTFAPAITLATAEGVLVRQLRMGDLVFFHDALAWTPDGAGVLYNGHNEACGPVIEARVDGSGEAVVLVDEQCPDLIVAFSYSPDGRRIAYLRTCLGSCNVFSSELVIRDATTLEAIELPCSLPPGFSNEVAWSPDGRKVAVDAQSNLAEDLFGSEIWIIDLEAHACAQITSGLGGGFSPSWSPDGSRIAFVSTRDGNPEIYVMNADGSDQRRLTSNTIFDAEPAWRP